MCRSQFSSDVNIWAYNCKLTLKLSLVVDFALSQRLRVACTIAVIRKSIHRYETGVTVVVFYQEAFLFEGRSTTSERPDKYTPSWDEILTWMLSDVRWTSQCPSLPISGSGSDSDLATEIFQWSCCNTQTYLLLTINTNYMQGRVGCPSDATPNKDNFKFWAKNDKCRQLPLT